MVSVCTKRVAAGALLAVAYMAGYVDALAQSQFRQTPYDYRPASARSSSGGWQHSQALVGGQSSQAMQASYQPPSTAAMPSQRQGWPFRSRRADSGASSQMTTNQASTGQFSAAPPAVASAYSTGGRSGGGPFAGLKRFFSRGQMAHPQPQQPPQPSVLSVREGVASWYGPDFHGGPTASGERYDMYSMTAAHKSLPFGTLVRVTNLNNGKDVVVRINNRGPYIKGRLIDLSKGAASQIDMVGRGIARVRLEILGQPQPEIQLASANVHR